MGENFLIKVKKSKWSDRVVGDKNDSFRACKMAGTSRWSLAFQRGSNLEVTAESTRRASRSRWKRSLTSSGTAPISVRSQRVRAWRGRERHRQASVLTKCLLSAAWVTAPGRVPPPTLPPHHRRVNQHGCTIGLSNLDLSRPRHELQWGSGPFRQPADLNTRRDNAFILWYYYF